MLFTEEELTELLKGTMPSGVSVISGACCHGNRSRDQRRQLFNKTETEIKVEKRQFGDIGMAFIAIVMRILILSSRYIAAEQDTCE